MAEFITQEKLSTKIEDIIFNATKEIVILSPYIKLGDYFKRLFSNHIKNHQVSIKIVFGKNADDKGKSLSNADFDFFKDFPNISILYLENLHAKYYANESEGVVTSINLHDYSFKNNIEFGVCSRNPTNNLLGVDIKLGLGDSVDTSAYETACELMEKAEVVFIKRPVIQKKLLGLSSHYVNSDVLYDNTHFFTSNFPKRYSGKRHTISDFDETIPFGKSLHDVKPTRREVEVELKTKNKYASDTLYQIKPIGNHNGRLGFCIRTGKAVDFNLELPFTDDAFKSWGRWKKENYREKFCHSCGRQHPTSKKNPLCDSCMHN
jgi:hypothetical protein